VRDKHERARGKGIKGSRCPIWKTHKKINQWNP